MPHEAIVLAGGFGTRLQKVVAEVPKPMAPVAGKPFLQRILDDLAAQNIRHVILAVGYLHQTIVSYFGDAYKNMRISYSIETEPLGTGGGIRYAMRFLEGNNAFIINGDTFFAVDLEKFYAFHAEKNAQLTLALKKMFRFDRYGTVEINAAGCVTGFNEKKYLDEGRINAGVYCLQTDLFADTLPEAFSFEKEILEKEFIKGTLWAKEFDGYFIDIGIPEDYEKAQKDFSGDALQFDKTWTLFLDRDGVINRKIDHDYVRTKEQFEFLPGALSALNKFSTVFGRIVIVTNQRGVGRGLMTETDLRSIHAYMLQTIADAGGRIDDLYFCTDVTAEGSTHRKPAPGMALDAQKKFPEIDFSRSVIAGDAISDMEFGRNLGMKTVLISAKPPVAADRQYPSLAAFADSIA